MKNMASLDDLKTAHLYYDDTALFTCEASVLKQEELEGKDGTKQLCLILDRTVMHPQGGGQPADTGVISSPDGSVRFDVSHVQKPKGKAFIQHIGVYTSEEQFSSGDEVCVEIDGEKRLLHARIHSAGHLLDTAFSNIGVTYLEPSKGYHFPDGPYVEYIGNIPAEKREDIMGQLNREMERLIQEATTVTVERNANGERVVAVGGLDCMCGGTHVKNTLDIKGVTVLRIKKSKKNVKVSYVIAD